ncbi:MAG TPA: TPM domain-containing protein, partial [Candidatus Enterococcus stercoravium]|nr:TPM domain-containing protein [Candidatus Enterococcus stercoravium]
MRKRLKYWLLLLLLALAWAPLTASANSTHIEDGVGLFTAEEIQSLEKKAQDLSDKIKGGVYVVTTNANNEEPRSFADEYLREKVGNDNNGAVLLLDMGQREVYVSTS